MFWVLQSDQFHENGREVMIQTLERFGIPYAVTQIIPFSQTDSNDPYSHQLSPEVTSEKPIITNGSIMLSKVAKYRGWQPGGFLNDNFDYEVWFPHFKDHLLNRDAVFSDVASANPDMEDIFVRPTLDSKSFNGQVMTRDEFSAWQKDVLAGMNTFVKPDTKIIYSPAKNIGQEHRHFIVDGEVITSSRYKLGGYSNFSEGCDRAVSWFAWQMAELWAPARAFVLDTYIAGDEIGIVELGCICNAGFYKADVQKLVMALDSMPGF